MIYRIILEEREGREMRLCIQTITQCLRNIKELLGLLDEDWFWYSLALLKWKISPSLTFWYSISCKNGKKCNHKKTRRKQMFMTFCQWKFCHSAIEHMSWQQIEAYKGDEMDVLNLWNFWHIVYCGWMTRRRRIWLRMNIVMRMRSPHLGPYWWKGVFFNCPPPPQVWKTYI